MKTRRINVLDGIILLVVIGVIAVAAYKFGVVNREHSTGIADESNTMRYTMLVKGVRQMTVDAFHQGDKLYDEKTDTYMGEIIEVSHAPQKIVEIGQDGEFQEVEKLDYFDVTLTIEGPVLEKDRGYFASGTLELKTNSEFPVYTKYAKPNAQIIELIR